MTIPPELVQEGSNREFQFRDTFVMPLLQRLGFGIVLNYHGQREYGRDVIFGDLDRFGHLVYYGMQIKYESSISLSDSHALVDDAEQATHNPFRHPQTGQEEFISTFYVANAGDISDAARENFFNTVRRKGIRDARLLDGNALALLSKAAALNRSAALQERLTGLLQEVRRNNSVLDLLSRSLPLFVENAKGNPFPMQRCRNSASAHYLAAPFIVAGLDIDAVDQYLEMVRMLTEIADSMNSPLANDEFRQKRLIPFSNLSDRIRSHGRLIENAALTLLTQLGEAPRARR